jgi:penicillin-insensitive murein endopeptidase
MRGLRYATPELIELLEEAAASVAKRYPGPRLGVGNLSRRRGGRIRFSRSHQSGRDADLAFYVTDARGRTVEPRDFVKINARGRGRRDLRFDVERNWALVEALLSSERAKIQWLLISRPLRRRLLAYAKATRAPAAILARARHVLHQPRWALPHDDHLHVRIYCSPRDVVRGCRDTGPRWPWVSSEPVVKVTTQTPAR